MVPVSEADAINVPSLFNVRQRIWDLCAFIMLTRFFSCPVGDTSTNWIWPTDLAGKARMVLDLIEDDDEDVKEEIDDDDPCTGITGDAIEVPVGTPEDNDADPFSAKSLVPAVSLNVVEFTLKSAKPNSLSMVS